MKKGRQLDTVVSALLEARPAMQAAYGPRRCIVCTRVALEACRSVGLRAIAVPVEVNITMPSGFEAHMGFDPPETDAGLRPKPLVSPVGKGFVRGEAMTIVVPEEIEVAYTPHLEDRDYLTCEDWSDKPERNRVLPNVLAAIKRS